MKPFKTEDPSEKKLQQLIHDEIDAEINALDKLAELQQKTPSQVEAEESKDPKPKQQAPTLAHAGASDKGQKFDQGSSSDEKDSPFSAHVTVTTTQVKDGEKLIGDDSSGFETQSEHTVSESEEALPVVKKVPKEKAGPLKADKPVVQMTDLLDFMNQKPVKKAPQNPGKPKPLKAAKAMKWKGSVSGESHDNNPYSAKSWVTDEDDYYTKGVLDESSDISQLTPNSAKGDPFVTVKEALKKP